MAFQNNAEFEVSEWAYVSRELRQHGMPTVEIFMATRADNMTDAVYFETDSSKLLRETLRSLMRDAQRRQELVKELIDTNSQLRDELKEQTAATERYETRARDLKAMLDDTLNSVNERDKYILNSSKATAENEHDQLLNAKVALQARCNQLEVRCRVQQEEMDALRERVAHLQEEEERSRVRHQEALTQLQKKMPRGGSINQEQLLDVLDSYEREIHKLRRLNQASKLSEHPHHDDSFEVEDTTPNYKAIIKNYKKEIRECQLKISKLENNNEVLQLELQARPELKTFREAQFKIKKLERMVKKNNCSHVAKCSTDNKKYSTEVEHIDRMPVAQCRKHLKEICTLVGVEDLQHIESAIHSYDKMAAAYVKLEEFASDVLKVVDSEAGLRHPEFPASNGCQKSHEVWCEKSVHHVIPTLQHWQKQLLSIQKLQSSVTELSAQLLPPGSQQDNTDASIDSLVQSLRRLLGDDPPPKQSTPKDAGGRPSRAVLQAMVDHFMRLFDVQSISAVYTRMNDIYSKMGETRNAVKALKQILALDDSASTGAVVEAVSRVCQAHNSTTTQQLQALLRTNDLDSVVRRLQEHDEFFPVFHHMVQTLMDVLDVNRIDLVVPTVCSLKISAGR